MEVEKMKVIVEYKENEIKAVLSDGHRPKLTNWYEKKDLSKVYDFAKWASERYNAAVEIEFR